MTFASNVISTIVGYQVFNFTDKTGKQVSGTKLHFISERDPELGESFVGQTVGISFISKIYPWVAVGKKITLTYGYNNKSQKMFVADIHLVDKA